MRKYCITGVRGYIGSLLAKRLLDAKEKFIGIDIHPANDSLYTYYQANILDKESLKNILTKEKITTLIHLAAYSAPEGDEKTAYEVNIRGFESILEIIPDTSVKRIVLSSSSAAYGSHPDNPVPLSETDPLRGNDNYYYAAHKKKQEELLQEFIQKHKNFSYMILRPCVILGKNINNQTGDLLRQPVLINPKSALNTPVQFIHENDAVEVFYLASKSEKNGIINVAPQSTTNMKEMAQTTGKRLVALPYKLLYYLANITKMLRITPVGGKSLQFTMNPIVVDPSLLKKTLNYTPAYNSIEVLADFVNTIKK